MILCGQLALGGYGPGLLLCAPLKHAALFQDILLQLPLLLLCALLGKPPFHTRGYGHAERSRTGGHIGTGYRQQRCLPGLYLIISVAGPFGVF